MRARDAALFARFCACALSVAELLLQLSHTHTRALCRRLGDRLTRQERLRGVREQKCCVRVVWLSTTWLGHACARALLDKGGNDAEVLSVRAVWLTVSFQVLASALYSPCSLLFYRLRQPSVHCVSLCIANVSLAICFWVNVYFLKFRYPCILLACECMRDSLYSVSPASLSVTHSSSARSPHKTKVGLWRWCVVMRLVLVGCEMNNRLLPLGLR